MRWGGNGEGEGERRTKPQIKENPGTEMCGQNCDHEICKSIQTYWSF